MPAEASVPAETPARQRRIGLRVALAIATGLTFDVATGAVIPFLGALFAAQFLISGGRPLPLAKALGLVGFVLVVGQVFILLSGVFAGRPLQFLSLLGLFYFLCFFTHARGRGGPTIFVSLVIAIMVPLLNLVQDQLDASIIAILFQGCLSGAILSWLAHAVVPDAAGPDEKPPQPAVALERPAMRAFASTVILLMAVAFCLTNNAFSTALVIPITVASLLLQLDHANSARAALGLMAINLLGGVLASLVFSFVELRPSLPFLFLTVLLVGLILAGRAQVVSAYSAMYAGALTAFLILLGTGISPLPTSTPESFSTRVSYVLLAIVYTLCMTALFWRGRRAGTAPA